MKIRGADFVLYSVTSLARAARFYREILGLRQEVYSEPDQWAEFDCGNVTLALHGGVKLPQKLAGGRLALAVKDVRAAGVELRKKRVRIRKPPQDYTVCWAMEIADPDGNGLSLHRRADGTCG
jgi:predicted enzyme related to lactoylglutathione lyase